MEYIQYSKRHDSLLPESKKNIFIITTYNSKPHHLTLLKLCISRIELYHPDADIVILNDSHSITLQGINPSIQIETTQYERCGEINAYIWACKHMNDYKNFIFIHDSVLLINRLQFDLEGINYRPLWYGSRCLNNNTQGNDIDTIVSVFRLNNKNISEKLNEIKKGHGSVIFGGMAVFNKLFLEYLVSKTNFMQVAYLFNTRHLRSFFERVLYIILSEFYMISNFHAYSLCGDIFDHKEAFESSCLLNSNLTLNLFALKVWQGR